MQTVPVCRACGKEARKYPHQNRYFKFCSPECVQRGPRRKTLEQRFWSKVDKNGPVPEHVPELGPCWVWTGSVMTMAGYGRIYIKPPMTATTSHRVSWEMHVGPVPAGMYVLHKCDRRTCVRPDHLFVGTHDDNMADMAIKGRCRQRKLSDDEVREIRSKYVPHVYTLSMLSAEYGLAPASVSKLLLRKNYRHVA